MGLILSCVTFLVFHQFQDFAHFQIPLITLFRMVYRNIDFNSVFVVSKFDLDLPPYLDTKVFSKNSDMFFEHSDLNHP